MTWRAHGLIFCLFMALSSVRASAAPDIKVADIGNGIRLHYVEAGQGPALILVHGSLSDGSYWNGQLDALARHYHVIAYSRRYNQPNSNTPVRGYSAVTDADDLAALIETLHLKRAYVIGHSYGALTALFLATRHPELLNAVVLAEPPAVSLLANVEGRDHAEAAQMYADINARMVAPMQAAFRAGQTEKGVAIFINYVFNNPNAWNNFSAADKQDTLKNAEEWNVILPNGELFPRLNPDAVHRIQVPVLLMSGARSYPFLNMIDRDLLRLIPHSERIIFSDSGHQMWLQHPDQARAYAEAFFDNHPPKP